MRILYVTGNSLLRSTTSSLNAIIRQLRPKGVEPVMVFREPGPWQESLLRDGVPCHFDALRTPEKRRPIRSLRDIVRLVRLAKRERIDLIHCNEHELYTIVRQVAHWSDLPAVVTLHWNLDAYGPWAFGHPHTPAAIQFLSQAQLDVSRPFLPTGIDQNRVKLLMSGLDLDEFLAKGDDGSSLRSSWRVGPGTIVLGTASAIKPRKHVEDFVRLIARLRRRGLDVRGMIAGGGRFADPEYLKMLQDLILKENLSEHCRMIGNLDPVTPFFKAIDISINTAEMEILSMSLCEGQACRKPTLAYAVGGNPEALPDPWCTVPFGDLDALEQKAARLIIDSPFRRELGVKAERFVREHFDAPVLAARQQAIYEEVLGRPLKPRVPAGSA
jgi:glycosyltransferase involved in cell wall biosynthesis